MEIVMTAPNGMIVHIAPGAKHNFSSIEEYNRFREDISLFGKNKSGKMMELPESQDVVKVDWDTFNRFCAYFGVDPN